MTRHYPLSLILALLTAALSYSQGTVSFQFSIPQEIVETDIKVKHYNQIAEKLKSNVHNKSIFSNATPFSITPHLSLLEIKDFGEAHMVKVVKLGISLSVQDLDNNITFQNLELVQIATADDVPKAISKAIASIKASDPKIKRFFEEADKEISTFYSTNCSKIIKSAQVNIERKLFNRAFAQLKYVPESTDCFPQAEKLLTHIYLNSREVNCSERLQKARMEKASQNFDEALYQLGLIDYNAKCYDEVKKMLAEIGAIVGDKTNAMREFEMRREEYKLKSDSEKVKILAISADFLQLQPGGEKEQ